MALLISRTREAKAAVVDLVNAAVLLWEGHPWVSVLTLDHPSAERSLIFLPREDERMFFSARQVQRWLEAWVCENPDYLIDAPAPSPEIKLLFYKTFGRPALVRRNGQVVVRPAPFKLT